MVVRCRVCGLYNTKADKNVSFHHFPKCIKRRQEWLNIIGEVFEKMDVKDSDVICSIHFDSDSFSDMQDYSFKKRKLSKSAVPSKEELLQYKKISVKMKKFCDNEAIINARLRFYGVKLDENGDLLENNGSINNCENNRNIINQVTDESNNVRFSQGNSPDLSRPTNSENSNEFNQKNVEVSDKNSEIRKAAVKRKTVADENILSHKKSCSEENIDTGSRNSSASVNEVKEQNEYRVKLESGFETFRRKDFAIDHKWKAFQSFVKQTRKSKSTAKKQKARLKKKITNLKELLQVLKQRDFLTRSAEEQVEASLSPGARQLIEGVLKGKKYPTFPDELKAFALTLHFYSPVAYNFVRKCFMKILPNPSTLRAWLKSFNYDPGISSEAMESVKNLIAGEKNELYFNLTFDEMSIRKHVRWNQFEKKFEGTVDLGIGQDVYDNAEPASNAIVFMLVCINKHFKIPVAYYLINALSSGEKKNLLTQVLRECHSNGINVRHVTFDGISSNVSMMEDLGAKIYENMSTSFFLHPDSEKRVYASLDSCHMLKLARNTLASSDLIDGDGNTISWKFFDRLVDLQEKEGLHLATKIRKRHSNFQNEKMKVSLAAQTLSTSVAIALDVCATDLELEQFEGAEATAKYCRVIDECFDILNSKNKFCKNPAKQAITKDNLEEMKTKVKANINYLQQLTVDGQPICKSGKRTAFIGLITGLNNAVQLAEDLFNEGQLQFLCTYKLSQDHLETFFSCIRRCGGFNNNPNVLQFKSAYRKLMCHASIRVSMSANCIPLDGTKLLMPLVRKQQKNELDNGSRELLLDVIDFNELLNTISGITLSEYVSEIVAYMSGAIVKMIQRQVKCGLCRESLILKPNEEPISVLQRRKAYGNLISASEDVILINRVAEKVLRSQESLTVKNIKEKLIVLTTRALPMGKLFSKYQHDFDDEPLWDHRNQLIRLVLNKYFQTRLNHDATHMLDIPIRIRKRNNNLTKFQGQ